MMKVQTQNSKNDFRYETSLDEKYIRIICGGEYYDLKEDHDGNLVVNTGSNRAVIMSHASNQILLNQTEL